MAADEEEPSCRPVKKKKKKPKVFYDAGEIIVYARSLYH